MRLLVRVLAVLVVLTAISAPARAGTPGVLTSARPPAVKGAAVYDGMLVSGTGAWTPEPTAYAYRWLRDGRGIAGATGRTYVPVLADLGHRLEVRVTAQDAAGDTASSTSAPTREVARAVLTPTGAPAVQGVPRYTHTVTASPATWSSKPAHVRYRWLVAGKPVAGATARRYAIAPGDVGARLRVVESASAPGYTTSTVRSAPVRAGYPEDVRRTVSYSVQTRGHVTAGVAVFERLAQQTYDDPRSWRGAGIAFHRVAHGGDFTLVLAQARTVPSYSSQCSATYSCRVGRYVIINETRWLHASPPWNRAGGTLRNYRDLVIDHETGHWLGRPDFNVCSGPGHPAPVMMEQSISLHGCTFNPWPLASELRAVGG